MDDVAAMELALAAAVVAGEHGDVPVGAVVLRDGVVVATGENRRELAGDPTAHAEVVAIRAAAAALGTWRLEGCTLVVTLEPCTMCAGAIGAARLDTVVIGADDPKAGAMGSRYNLAADARLNHRVTLRTGVLAERSGALLTDFFATRRTPPA